MLRGTRAIPRGRTPALEREHRFARRHGRRQPPVMAHRGAEVAQLAHRRASWPLPRRHSWSLDPMPRECQRPAAPVNGAQANPSWSASSAAIAPAQNRWSRQIDARSRSGAASGRARAPSRTALGTVRAPASTIGGRASASDAHGTQRARACGDLATMRRERGEHDERRSGGSSAGPRWSRAGSSRRSTRAPPRAARARGGRRPGRRTSGRTTARPAETRRRRWRTRSRSQPDPRVGVQSVARFRVGLREGVHFAPGSARRRTRPRRRASCSRPAAACRSAPG